MSKIKFSHLSIAMFAVLGISACGGGNNNPAPTPNLPTACNSTVLAFNTTNFNFYTTDSNMLIPSNTSEQQLIPDNLLSAGAAVLLKQPMTPPYSIQFDYAIFDDDGQANQSFSNNSADGIVVMLAKDDVPYLSTLPPFGEARGFLPGDGYGVHFSIYQNREMKLIDPAGATLTSDSSNSATIYTHGEWRTVKITVRSDSIAVDYEGMTDVLKYDGAITQSYDHIGFGAGTGGADGEHKIRNVIVCSL